MRKTVLFLGLVVVVASAAFGQIQFIARLDGSQETPPVTTSATGTGVFTLSANGTALTYNVTVNGLTPTAGHFHNAAVGIPGGVVKPLTIVNNNATGVWSSTDATNPLTDSLLSELLRGRLYVNFHTTANPGGEIRGQVLMAAPATFAAQMDGSHENPPVATSATGSAFVVLAPNGVVTYYMTCSGLTPTAAHFHNGPVGVNAGVVKPFALSNNSTSGTWSATDATNPLTDRLLRELVKGNIYANAHTTTNPGGEIRGQVLPTSGLTFMATINGGQETPPVTTTANGTGWFVLNAAGTALSYTITMTGLTLTASHFHDAPAGTLGAVVRDLAFTNGTASGVWSSSDASQPLTDALLTELLNGRLYVNGHTTANPGGEIRGQVMAASGLSYGVLMQGSNETPAPITTNAIGTGSAVLNPNGTITYDMTVTGLVPTAAHFHDGAAGVSGPVVKGFTLTNNTTTGVWASTDASQPLTDALLREYVRGNLYMNAHTTAHPGGEIRGQVATSSAVVSSVGQPDQGGAPDAFQLSQNYPNPFNPSTVIGFDLTRAGRVTLRVYNMLGQEVSTLVDGQKGAGSYSVTFNAGSIPSGVYFYTLSADGVSIQTRKMMLLK